jgi:hypothetical protein
LRFPGVAAQAARPAVRRSLIVGVIALAAVAHVQVLLRRNINWDEFWFLSFVHDYVRGTLATPLQSFHVHVFGWLPAVGGDEVAQILTGRAALLILLAGTCACVYRLARRAASVEASWFAVLCVAGYTNIVSHGTSFRTDGLTVFLLMAAIVLAQNRTRRPAALAASAVLAALALLVTLKSVLFLPTIGVALITASGSESRLRAAKDALLFAIVLAAAALGLYVWHASTLAGTGALGPVDTFLRTSADKAVRRDVFFPGFYAFRETVRGNLIQWGLLLYAITVLARRLPARQQVGETLAALALLLPLISLAFYRNTFPYFFVFLMPPALVLCAVTFDELAGRRAGPLRDGHLTVLATLAIAIAVAWSGLRPAPDGTRPQREVVRAVHEIFPDPVPYIDRSGMIASFPKVGFFMSTWGLDNYRAAGVPVFADLLRTRRPRLLIDNGPALNAAFGGRGTPLLFDEDAAALKRSFVRYWGPLYVAGTGMRLEPDVEARWDVLIAGSYRLKGDGPVIIGGVEYSPGAAVDVREGPVALRSAQVQDILLFTTEAREPPAYLPPKEPIFSGFGVSAPIIRFPG